LEKLNFLPVLRLEKLKNTRAFWLEKLKCTGVFRLEKLRIVLKKPAVYATIRLYDRKYFLLYW